MNRLTLAAIVLLVSISLRISNIAGQEFTNPRATALGGNVAVSDDVYGLDYNVSGLAFSQSNKVQLSFTNRNLRLVTIRNLGLRLEVAARHVFAVRKTPEFQTKVRFRKTPVAQQPDEVAFYDILSQAIADQDWAIGYAFRISPLLALGIDAKRYRFGDSLFGFPSSSRHWSFSLGATYEFNDRLRVGLVSRNMLTYKYKDHRDRVILQFEGEPDVRVLPLDLDAVPKIVTKPQWRLDLGLAARPFKPLLLTLDLQTDGGIAAGFELEPLRGFYLRSGVSHRQDGLFKAQKLFFLGHGLGYQLGTARFDLTFYHSQGRDIATAAIPNGELHIRPNIGGDRIWMMSALFFVK